ncbi:LOW QUALITY PROTEIN: cytochrome b5 reductase 4-like [Macrobrachium nipponense]|uniref:LOW QUALITY PROTEIN: cytochrome b5 reductase 4-like n=1 Tax=Macrobrachium nipponense TaxID=159736 RepID=UPI0030C8D27A
MMGTVLGCVGQSTRDSVKPLSATSSSSGNPRNKTALKPGRSLMDWVRLGHSGTDLTGTGGRLLDVTPHELAKHNKRNDCWMVLKGKVYNVTPYMEFHPGGEEELMRGVGIDATDLFNEVHKWVNYESLLQKCLVGRLVESRSLFLKPSFLPLGKSTKEANKKNVTQIPPSNSLAVPSLNVPAQKGGGSNLKSPLLSPMTPSSLPTPKYDWFQNDSRINIVVYSKWKHITKEHVVVIKRGKEMKIVCYILDMVYTVHLDFHKPVSDEFELKTGCGTGKVDIMLNKAETGVRWSNIGKTLEENGKYVKSKDKQIEYVECSLLKKSNITHDTRMFVLEVPKFTYLPVPIGYHVYIRIPGKDVCKPYTPVAAKLNVAAEEELGHHIYLFIKIYPDGALTPLLDDLSLESKIEVSLPEGTFTHDKLTIAVDTATDLVLLGAGTGITPLVKVMLAGLKNEKNIRLVLFNKTEGDIPWREELESLVADHSNILKVTHILSRPSDSWSGMQGHIRKDLLQKILPVNDETVLFTCICGPTIFTKLSVNLLKDLGYSSETYHAFLG